MCFYRIGMVYDKSKTGLVDMRVCSSLNAILIIYIFVQLAEMKLVIGRQMQ